MGSTKQYKKEGFSLIELIVVVAVIAILAVVVLLTLNPAQLLMQSRDAQRIGDLNTINKAVSVYYSDALTNPSTLFMGSSSIVYVSIPDPTATSTAGDQCQGLSLPTLASGYTYQCAATSTDLNVNGTGWVPINFTSYSAGSLISQLPGDPVNNTSSLLYYTYMTNGTQYEITAALESQKYLKQYLLTTNVDPTRYAVGTNASLIPQAEGLVGYYPFDEGTGSIATDLSGNGNNGTWAGTPAGTSGYYAAGKVGPWAGDFDGSTDAVTEPNSSLFNFGAGSYTISAWINTASLSPYQVVVGKSNGSDASNFRAFVNSGGALTLFWGSDGSAYSNGPNISANLWVDAVWGYDASSGQVFYGVNGVKTAITNSNHSVSNSQSVHIGNDTSGGYRFTGTIDDVRIYNRALSAAEIQEIYNAEK